MTAALPFVDQFLSGHDVNSLERLVEALADPGLRRAG